LIKGDLGGFGVSRDNHQTFFFVSNERRTLNIERPTSNEKQTSIKSSRLEVRRSNEDKGMKKKIEVFFTAGFMILAMLSGCLPAKQVVGGNNDPNKRIKPEEVRKADDRAEEYKKKEALIKKLEEAEKRLLEMERKNQEAFRRLEEASKKTERAMERIEKAGEKIEAVGKKEAP
jgi:hypothetical protein